MEGSGNPSKLPEASAAKQDNKVQHLLHHRPSLKNLAWYVPLISKPQKEKIPCVPLVEWKCPPKITLDPSWCVANGEASVEALNQTCRETTVPEVIYHQPFDIPSDPSTPPPVEDDNCDDNRISIIPIVEQEEGEEFPSDSSESVDATNFLLSLGWPSQILPSSQSYTSGSQSRSAGVNPLLEILHGLDDIDLEVAVAAAANAASINDITKQIDPVLLLKFLANPEMVKKLMAESGLSSNPGLGTPLAQMHASVAKPSNSQSVSVPCNNIKTETVSASNRGSISAGKAPMFTPDPQSLSGCQRLSLPQYTLKQERSPFTMRSEEETGKCSETVNVIRVPNYQQRPNPSVLASAQPKLSTVMPVGNQHPSRSNISSGKKPETQESKRQKLGESGNMQGLEPKPGLTNPKYQKHCMFFHTSKGCWYGSCCRYWHDV